MLRLLTLLLIALILISEVSGGFKWKNKSKTKTDSKSKSKTRNKNRSRKKSTPAPVTPAPTTPQPTPSPTPSNDELCGCYNIDLICEPFSNNDNEICYYYKIEKISDADYCDGVNYLSLGTGDIDQCGLTSYDINGLITDYAPSCYNVNPLSDAIKVTFDGSTSPNPYSGSAKSSYKSKTKSDAKSSESSASGIIYLLCRIFCPLHC